MGGDALPYPDADALANHWWWRPGWQVGTRFYAWHITVADLEPLAEHVAAYQAALRGFAFLDPIPTPWLHITVQGLDHVASVSASARDAAIAAVRERLAALPTPSIEFGVPVLHREAVVIPPTDPAPLLTIRDAVRAGIQASYGPPEGKPTSAFRPHVSVAYVNAPNDPRPARETLDAVDAPPVVVPVTHVSLIEMHRDNRMYEWNSVESVGVGTGR